MWDGEHEAEGEPEEVLRAIGIDPAPVLGGDSDPTASDFDVARLSGLVRAGFELGYARHRELWVSVFRVRRPARVEHGMEEIWIGD